MVLPQWSYLNDCWVRMMLLLASMNGCVSLFVALERSLIEINCFFIFGVTESRVIAIFSHYFIHCFLLLILEHGNTSIWFISTRLFVDWPSLFTNLSPSFCFEFFLFCLFYCFFFEFLSSLLVTIDDVYYYYVQYPCCYYRSSLSVRSPFGWLFLSEVLSVDSFYRKSSRSTLSVGSPLSWLFPSEVLSGCVSLFVALERSLIRAFCGNKINNKKNHNTNKKKTPALACQINIERYQQSW